MVPRTEGQVVTFLANSLTGVRFFKSEKEGDKHCKEVVQLYRKNMKAVRAYGKDIKAAIRHAFAEHLEQELSDAKLAGLIEHAFGDNLTWRPVIALLRSK